MGKRRKREGSERERVGEAQREEKDGEREEERERGGGEESERGRKREDKRDESGWRGAECAGEKGGGVLHFLFMSSVDLSYTSFLRIMAHGLFL